MGFGMVSVWCVEVFFVVYLDLIECVCVLIVVMLCGSIVLWEYLKLLYEVDGLVGMFCVLCVISMFDVDNDYVVVYVWLLLYELVVMWCVYWKEVEWLILWVIVECGCVLLLLMIEDVFVYCVFIWWLMLYECWVGFVWLCGVFDWWLFLGVLFVCLVVYMLLVFGVLFCWLIE